METPTSKAKNSQRVIFIFQTKGRVTKDLRVTNKPQQSHDIYLYLYLQVGQQLKRE